MVGSARLLLMKRFVFIIVLILAGCGGSSKTATVIPGAGAEVDSSLGAGDHLEVRVYEEKELSGKFRVDDDGTIDYPFLGAIKVEGLRPTQVSQLITGQLVEKGYLKHPQVSVLVESYGSKRVVLLGAVAKPGTYPLASGMTLVQLLSMAGGFTGLAAKDDTMLTRRQNGKTVRYKLSAQQMVEGHADDFPIQPGDSIFVPERLF